MARALYLLFGVVAYCIFFATFLYLIAFVGDLPGVPRTVDRGPVVAVGAAIVVDIALIALFGLQHSVMARQGFKRGWTRIVPHPSDRRPYMRFDILDLTVMFLFWLPLPNHVWYIQK